MPKLQRTREVLSRPLTAADLDQKASQGWKPVAVIWERQVEDQADSGPLLADITTPVPYGLKIAEDCTTLEQDVLEREALIVMLEMIIQDKPLSETADELNRRGLRTRNNSKWTPGSVFDMLPRLIEVGPRVFNTEEWVVRRGKLMNVV
jgi:Recombinase